MTRRIFRLLFTTVALAAIAIGAAMLSMRAAIHGTEVQVPTLTGLSIADATREAAGAGLNSSVEDRMYSTDVPAGRVMQQSPDPGTSVRREWTVRMIESLGPQNITIPDVMGMDERTAVLNIRQANLDVGTVATIAHPGAKPGTVVAQDPAPGAQGVDRPRVSIVLAQESAAAENTYVMPLFVGQPFAQAAATVAGAGMKLANPMTGDATDPALASGHASIATGSAAGTILAQRPAAGSKVAPGTVVHFTVTP